MERTDDLFKHLAEILFSGKIRSRDEFANVASEALSKHVVEAEIDIVHRRCEELGITERSIEVVVKRDNYKYFFFNNRFVVGIQDFEPSKHFKFRDGGIELNLHFVSGEDKVPMELMERFGGKKAPSSFAKELAKENYHLAQALSSLMQTVHDTVTFEYSQAKSVLSERQKRQERQASPEHNF